MKFQLFSTWQAFFAICLATALFRGPIFAVENSTTTTAATDALTNTRYGLFNGLDHRSSYGLGLFPEPFLVDDSDLEVNEARVDWFYTRAAGHQRGNAVSFEIEKGFGNLTVELKVGYEIDKATDGNSHGWNSIKAGVRYPLFQAVAPSGFADTTFGVSAEVGVPVDTIFSRNTELVPGIFNDTKIGNFTIQSVAGYSMLVGGGGEDAGLLTLEYGITLGYAIQKPMPGVEQFIPVFEILGEKHANHDHTNSIVANAAFRINLKAIGGVQPRLGVGYVFPLNNVALNDIQSGIYTSFAFDF